MTQTLSAKTTETVKQVDKLEAALSELDKATRRDLAAERKKTMDETSALEVCVHVRVCVCMFVRSESRKKENHG